VSAGSSARRAARTRIALAQNLFAGPGPARTLVAIAGVRPGERVYDLGAGTGLISSALVVTGARVVAVERDPNLARKLWERFAGRDVRVIEADLANVAFAPPFSVVANPPFNLTAALLRRLLFDGPHPASATLALQREAARKYAGLPAETLVSLSAKPWFELTVAEPFRRRDFTPAPSVDVAVLRIVRRATPDLPSAQRDAWRGFVRGVLERGKPDAWHSFRGRLSNLQWRRLAADLGLARDARLAELGYDDWLAVFRFAQALTPARVRTRSAPRPSRPPPC
jgi:23S rRNA (adenine-N6)-dimethyltransferase